MYKLRIGFVDTSYCWDDGNRSTAIIKEFLTLEEVETFISQYTKEPFTFKGREGEVKSIIELDNLYLTRTVVENIDLKSLPSLRKWAEAEVIKELETVARMGGNAKEIEEKMSKLFSWPRYRFLQEWKVAMKKAIQ